MNIGSAWARTEEKSPNYRLVMYKPQEQTQSQSSEMAGSEEIPY